MLVMGFQKNWIVGCVPGVSSIQYYFGFLTFQSPSDANCCLHDECSMLKDYVARVAHVHVKVY